MRRTLKTLALGFDRIFEVFSLCALALMVIIVTIQVFTRTFWNYVHPWSEEWTLLLLIWSAFLGIAIGFREKLHLSMDSLTRRLPDTTRRILSRVLAAVVFGFGVYMVVYGWEYTELMQPNTLAATGWSRSIQYVVFPISGLMICIYSFLQVIGIDTRRHQGIDDDDEEEGST